MKKKRCEGWNNIHTDKLNKNFVEFQRQHRRILK